MNAALEIHDQNGKQILTVMKTVNGEYDRFGRVLQELCFEAMRYNSEELALHLILSFEKIFHTEHWKLSAPVNTEEVDYFYLIELTKKGHRMIVLHNEQLIHDFILGDF